MKRKNGTSGSSYIEEARRHSSLLMEDLLDNLEEESAFSWLIHRMDEDRHHQKHPLHVYRTNLFSIYVDYDAQTAFVSAELGCHPPDETFVLLDFYDTVREHIPSFEPDCGGSIKYGDNIAVHVYRKKF